MRPRTRTRAARRTGPAVGDVVVCLDPADADALAAALSEIARTGSEATSRTCRRYQDALAGPSIDRAELLTICAYLERSVRPSEDEDERSTNMQRALRFAGRMLARRT